MREPNRPLFESIHELLYGDECWSRKFYATHIFQAFPELRMVNLELKNSAESDPIYYWGAVEVDFASDDDRKKLIDRCGIPECVDIYGREDDREILEYIDRFGSENDLSSVFSKEDFPQIYKSDL